MFDQQSLDGTSSHSRSDSVWTTTTASSSSSPPSPSSAHSITPSSPTSVNYAYAFWGVTLDPACLEAIDDQLLESPTAAFADVCWQQAVKDNHTRARPRRPRRSPRRASTTTSVIPSPIRELPEPIPLQLPSTASSKRASTPVTFPKLISEDADLWTNVTPLRHAGTWSQTESEDSFPATPQPMRSDRPGIFRRVSVLVAAGFYGRTSKR